jgi:alkanesulfonate monooxygenase SsuD/methylene tetrahydromethanopterin reductase-like flavin-dependent oxidoreductase (luciferase family)
VLKPIFGVRLPNSGPLASPEALKRIAVAADQLGFGAVTVHDHVTLGPGEKYHFSDGTAENLEELERLGAPTSTFYETVSLLSYVAGITQRVRLIPACWILAWRHPVLFAKQVATMHELSGRRLILVAAIGNILSDFKAMGVPWEKRGKITNEYLEVLKLIFSSEKSVSYKGDFVSFPDTEFFPKPNGMPLWIGGTTNRFAYERIARYGTGWFAGGESPEDFTKARDDLDGYMRNHGRTVNEIEIGRQTFLRLGANTDGARAEAEPTIRKFFSGHEFVVSEKELIQKAMSNSFIGTPEQIVRLTEQYIHANVTTHDMRLIATSVEDALSMMGILARDVLPSFS